MNRSGPEGRTHICSHFSSKPAIVSQITSSTASMMKVAKYMFGLWATIAMEKKMITCQPSAGLQPTDLPGGVWQQNMWGTWQHREAADGESTEIDDDNRKDGRRMTWGTWASARSSPDKEKAMKEGQFSTRAA